MTGCRARRLLRLAHRPRPASPSPRPGLVEKDVYGSDSRSDPAYRWFEGFEYSHSEAAFPVVLGFVPNERNWR